MFAGQHDRRCKPAAVTLHDNISDARISQDRRSHPLESAVELRLNTLDTVSGGLDHSVCRTAPRALARVSDKRALGLLGHVGVRKARRVQQAVLGGREPAALARRQVAELEMPYRLAMEVQQV